MLGGILAVKYQDESYLGSSGSMSDHMAVRWTLGSYWGMLMPSLAWLECVSTSWMIKWLMPSVGPPVPLTWIQCGIIYNCSHYLTLTLTTQPGTDWFLNPGLGRDPRDRIHQIIRSMLRWCRGYSQASGHTPPCKTNELLGKLGLVLNSILCDLCSRSSLIC